MGIAERLRNGITRRGFVVGGLAAGAGAAALAGCSSGGGSSKDASGEPQVVKDSSKIVSVVDEYEAVDIDLEAASTWTLPLGTLLSYCEGDYAAAMMAPASAQHANTLGVLNIGDGSLTTLVESPVKGGSYGFYDVRAGESVFAWVEMDYAASAWTLFAQELAGGALSGDAVELDHGGKNFDPPQFTATGSQVIWYKMPSTSGNKTGDDSYCYSRAIGDGKAQTIWTSTGRFASAPRVSDGILTISPRVRNDEGVYYGMTALDLADGNNTRRAQLVLPSSVVPFEAVYMGDKFVFSIEATYDGVGSLGNMGTYIGAEGGPYVYLSREPLACAAGKGSRYLIKAQASHFLVDTSKKTYGTLLSPDRALDYGDYPASAGEVSSFITYATVRNSQGIPETVTARLFSL